MNNSWVTVVLAEMLTATFEVGFYQIHDTEPVDRDQNIIEKHTTAWQHDEESAAVPNNKRIVRQGKNGCVRQSQRTSWHEWEKSSLAHGKAEKNGT